MKEIMLGKGPKSGLVIMIFVEGTILKPKNWWSMYNHKSYVPIGDGHTFKEEWLSRELITL